MKSLEDTPAGELDSYSEKVRERRAKEIAEDAKSLNLRPVKHIARVMLDFIEVKQDQLRQQK